jgi:hypothetical protein
MMSPDDIKTIAAMEKYGGEFVQKLAAAYVKADSENRILIRLTWPNLWEKYSELAERLSQ